MIPPDRPLVCQTSPPIVQLLAIIATTWSVQGTETLYKFLDYRTLQIVTSKYLVTNMTGFIRISSKPEEITEWNLPPIAKIHGERHSTCDAVLALNYGADPLFSNLHSLLSKGRNDIGDLFLYWNSALVGDLLDALFPQTESITSIIVGQNSVRLPAYETLRLEKDLVIARRILATLTELPFRLSRELRSPAPLALYVVDVIHFLGYLRRNVKRSPSHKKKGMKGYKEESRRFWKLLLSMDTSSPKI